jgi:predicted nicotinamide N-methyase
VTLLISFVGPELSFCRDGDVFKKEADMFRGKAELRSLDTNDEIATFTETCEDDGFSHARVVLKPPITLTGTESLGLFGGPGVVIAVAAENGGPTVVHEFHGKSGVGCLAANAEVSLTKSPGGDLSTLLVVLGKGTIHREHH